jgi:hypothetical protein
MSESPRIRRIEWGAIEVEGIGRAGDLKLWPGGGREWDWAETNTHHSPGIQVADVLELLEHGTRVVVLSRGMELRLETMPETLQCLRLAQVTTHVEETKEAVELYNALAASGELVAGLFHSTC